jgi:hypothetical protein
VLTGSALALGSVLALMAVPRALLMLVGGGVGGVALGFGNLHGLTRAQSHVPSDLMDRVISVLMMGSVGLIPISMLIAGVAVSVSLDALFIVAGAGMGVLCAGSLLSPAVRHLGLEPGYEAAAAASEAGDDVATAPGAPTEPARA